MVRLETGQPRKGRASNVLIMLGLLLIAAALCLAAYNVRESARAGEDSAAALTQMAASIPETGGARPDANLPMPTTVVNGQVYVGRLIVPSLGLGLPVLSEWSYEGLNVAPCRYSGSAYAGDLVICGHNYWSHFAALEDLAYGAEVLFEDMRGNVFRYEVASLETLPATAVEDMVESDYDLSLFTCNFSGMARVTVRCVEVF